MTFQKAEYDNILYSPSNSPFVTAFETKVNSEARFKLSWHEEMEIKYILSGSLYIDVGVERIYAQKGDIVIINPCEHHRNFVKQGTEASYNILCVDVSRVFGSVILKSENVPYEITNMRFCNIIRGDSEAKRYLEMFFDAAMKNDMLLQMGLFIAFFSSLKPYVDLKKTGKAGDKHYMIQEEIVNKALFHIHSHYRERIKVRDMADMCYVSESHFCRVFTEFTGDTPINYINKLRIDKAISIMKNTDLAVCAIGQEVGFSEETYFSKCFKKYTGLAPGQYRKNIR